jgi:hypothetical protein
MEESKEGGSEAHQDAMEPSLKLSILLAEHFRRRQHNSTKKVTVGRQDLPVEGSILQMELLGTRLPCFLSVLRISTLAAKHRQ